MPLENGTYHVHFTTPLSEGNGVVILRDGQLRGGDSRIYYTGIYTQVGDQFTAQVRTDAHSNLPGMMNVFGQDRVNITISGNVVGNDHATLTGTAKEAPGVKFGASLRRLGD